MGVIYSFFSWLTLIVGELAWLGIFGYYIYGYVQAFIKEVDYEYPFSWMQDPTTQYSQSLRGTVFTVLFFGWGLVFVGAAFWPLTYIVAGAAGALYHLRAENRKKNTS